MVIVKNISGINTYLGPRMLNVLLGKFFIFIISWILYSENSVKSESKDGIQGGINPKKEQETPSGKGEKVPEDVILLRSGMIDITVPKNDETITFLVSMLNGMKTKQHQHKPD